ncbi:hypothetical protein A249_03818, partial [Pseudomonas syringae pv. actinidiae ICMP 18804]
MAHQQGQFLAVSWHPKTLVDRFYQAQAGVFVGDVPGPFGFWRQSLAQIMQQAGPAHGQRVF